MSNAASIHDVAGGHVWRKPAFLSALAFCGLATNQVGAAEQKFGRWTLNDEQSICAAILDTGENSLALVVRSGGIASFAIVGPDIPSAEPNSSAELTITIDKTSRKLTGRATRRDSQTGYVVADPGLMDLLDQHGAGFALSASLAGKKIFAIDATKSAEPIAALKDCAASGHL